MTGLTITANVGQPAAAGSTPGVEDMRRRSSTAASSGTRTSSPTRPPVSPITPKFGPTQLPSGPASDAAHAAATTGTTSTASEPIPDFALGRPTFTHTTQTDQVGISPPPAQPIDFEENTDVLALKSAITILQLQRQRAIADIRRLRDAKEAALANPETFIADLAAGKIQMEGTEPRFPAGEGLSQEDSDDTKDDVDDVCGNGTNDDGGKEGTSGQKAKQKSVTKDSNPAWRRLPNRQNIVRCPPINWAKYGVVGESLDKLHAEQVAAPTPGAPLTLGPSLVPSDFRTGSSVAGAGDQNPSVGMGTGSSQQRGERLVGVSAPYDPLRDKLPEKKGKGGRR